MRLSLKRPSNLRRRSRAHSSPYWPSEDDGLELNGVPRPSIVKQLQLGDIVSQVGDEDAAEQLYVVLQRNGTFEHRSRWNMKIRNEMFRVEMRCWVKCCRN